MELHATRAESDPRRFVRVRIHFAVRGAVEMQHGFWKRAIAFSRNVLLVMSLRQDVTLETTTSITA